MLQAVTIYHVTDRYNISCYRPSQYILLQIVKIYHVTDLHYVSCYRPSLRITLQIITTCHIPSFNIMAQTLIRSHIVSNYHVSVCVVWFIFVILFLPSSPNGVTPEPPHCRGFTITLRHTTLGSTALEEWSARRRDLYLTTDISILSISETPQTHASDRADSGIGISFLVLVDICGFIENGVQALVWWW
jgi:hypothetical protein